MKSCQNVHFVGEKCVYYTKSNRRTMKKITIAILLCGISSIILAQDLPNVGFENWTMNFLYEGLADWNSSNSEGGADMTGITKSIDAFSGDYSVRLESILDGEDSIFSFIYLGALGENGPAGGFEYTDDFDQLAFQYKCNMPEVDSASIYLIKYIGGVANEHLYKIGGVHETWTELTVDITPGAADSLFFGFISSDIVDETAIEFDSWVQFDSVYFKNTMGLGPAALPNFDFENWINYEYIDIDEWYTMNGFLYSAGVASAVQSTDAYSGTYSIELTTHDVMGAYIIPGYLSIGEITMDDLDPILPVPYTYQPTTISGYYKYIPVADDEAFFSIQMDAAGETVGGNMGPLAAVAEWTYFETELTYSDVPETLELVFFSGELAGSVLYLDDVNFDFDTNNNISESQGFSIYPNPTSEYFVVNLGENSNSTIEIIDMQGRIVKSVELSNSISRIDVSDISVGVYIVKTNIEGQSAKKLIIK